MIGNDIVDLKQAAKESPDSYRDGKRYQRFLDKAFTTEEQLLITNSKDQHQLVWLLWSMKEAAYKVNVQQFGKRFFNPKKLVCNLISETKGFVMIGEESYFTTSTITEEYIYTVATLEASKDLKSECFEVENSSYHSQSEALRRNFLKVISEIKNVSIERLTVKKNEISIPRLLLDGFRLSDEFSLTHHGKLCVWVYIIKKDLTSF